MKKSIRENKKGSAAFKVFMKASFVPKFRRLIVNKIKGPTVRAGGPAAQAGAATFSRLDSTIRAGSDGIDPQQGWRFQRTGRAGELSSLSSLLDRRCHLFPLLLASQTGTHYSVWQFEMEIL